MTRIEDLAMQVTGTIPVTLKKKIGQYTSYLQDLDKANSLFENEPSEDNKKEVEKYQAAIDNLSSEIEPKLTSILEKENEKANSQETAKTTLKQPEKETQETNAETATSEKSEESTEEESQEQNPENNHSEDESDNQDSAGEENGSESSTHEEQEQNPIEHHQPNPPAPNNERQFAPPVKELTEEEKLAKSKKRTKMILGIAGVIASAALAGIGIKIISKNT